MHRRVVVIVMATVTVAGSDRLKPRRDQDFSVSDTCFASATVCLPVGEYRTGSILNSSAREPHQHTHMCLHATSKTLKFVTAFERRDDAP